MSEKKINVLVLPALFPEEGNNSKGIFVLDYIESVLTYANVIVFTIQLHGKKKGIFKENYNGIEVHRMIISDKKPANPISKFLLYTKWFKQGVAYAKTICNDVDVIHVHNSALYGNIAYELNKTTGIPYVITEHTGPFSKISNNKALRQFAKRAWKKCSALMTVSDDLTRQIKTSGMNAPQTTTTYNPVNTNLFSLCAETEKNKTITFASRLEDYKGGLRVAKAFQKIASDFPEWKLVIMGDGKEKIAIEEFVKNNSLQNKIVLTGEFNKKVMHNQFTKSSFFVFPSEHETFGLVVAEAMSSGLPVIVGNETAPKEVVEDGCTILVSPNDVDAIANAMKQLINERTKYNSEKIRASVVTRFGFEIFGQRLKEIYMKAITLNAKP